MPRALRPKGFVAHERVAAWPAAAVATWGAASLLQWTGAAVVPELLALALALPALAGAAFLLALDRGRPVAARRDAAGALLALAFAGAIAGHVLHPRGAAFAPWMAPQVGVTLGVNGLAGLLAALAAVALVPLVAGWRLRALDLALDASARLPTALPLAALHARDASGLLAAPTGRDLARGAARAWLRGLATPGLVALDLADRALRVTRRSHRVRADVALEALHDALKNEGAVVSLEGPRLDAELPREGAPALHVRIARARGGALDVRGSPDAALELRRLLEGPLSHVALHTWSRPARRWEARLNALLESAPRASSLEERSALYEEAQRIERMLEARDLAAEEWSVLRAWKAQRLRAFLAHALLSEPVGARGDALVAPAPALLPRLDVVMGAGGLSSLRRVVFAPYWIVPVRSSWGELEIAVDAQSGDVDLALSERILEAARSEGARLLLDMPHGPTFLTAPEPSAALLRTLREKVPRGVDVARAAATPAERVLVPFVPKGDAYVGGVTGEPANALGQAPRERPTSPGPLKEA